MAELKKLRECPFCGGEAMLDREDIFCDNCHLSMRIDDRKYNGEAETYEEAREQAIEAWNNRATESEIRAKAIDEFAEKFIYTAICEGCSGCTNCYETGSQYRCDRYSYMKQVAEQLRGNEE